MNAHRPKITASQSPAGNLAGTVKSTSPAVPATFSRGFVRVAGEAMDADPYTPNCSECGKNEYACLCEDPWGYGLEPRKSREQIEADYQWALDRIARVFLGVGA